MHRFAYDMPKTDVYLEIGTKKVFACALHWPGWSRAGKDAESAIEALIDYAPRYARVVPKSLGFPTTGGEVRVVEKLKGNATTDYGAPGAIPELDRQAAGAYDTRRLLTILRGCWKEFDRSVGLASGKQLATGPRGGGRNVERMIAHVIEGDLGYLGTLGWRTKASEMADVRGAVADALTAKSKGEIPDVGPRGGTRWPARFFVRRSAWHVLDHAWELQDRISS